MKAMLNELIGTTQVRENVTLAPYTTFKMGGPAEFYFEAYKEEDISKAVKVAHTLGIPVHVLGGASNIVVRDIGIKGLVIRNRTSDKKIIDEDETSVLLHVSSGYSMTRLAKETAEQGWGGLERHLGLPGTVGGALFMNSKWVDAEKTYYVGDGVEKAALVKQDATAHVVDHDYFNFGYDYSKIQETGEYVVWVQFKLQKGDPHMLIKNSKKALAYRKQTQPFGVATSGCFFKNVHGKSAGQMIDDLDLKGYAIGGAHVSDVHANFILNNGSATTEDVEKLIREIKRRVKAHYNIELEQEVVII